LKKKIITVLFIFNISYVISQEFEISKISEIAYAQEFRSPEGIQIVENYLYFLNLNGLEIYEISNDGSLTKISFVAIPNPSGMVIFEQNCYISINGYPVDGFYAKIFRIDISDVYDPEIIDQLGFNNYVGNINLVVMSNNLVVSRETTWDILHTSFSLPEMEYLGQVDDDNYYHKINDDCLVHQENNIIYLRQYVPDGNYLLFGTTDVSEYSDNGGYYEHFKTINDTILSAVNTKNITFWNISDIANWQYISRYTLPDNVFVNGASGNGQYLVKDDKIILFTSDYMRLINISNVYTPNVIDLFDNNIYMSFLGHACDHYNDNVYVGTIDDGIQIFLVDSNIELIENYYENLRFCTGLMYQENLIIGNLQTGYQLFNIENPNNSIDLGDWFDEKYYINRVHQTGNWMILTDYNELTLEIYNITDIENPELTNLLPLDDYGFSNTYWSIDENDPYSFYLWNHQTRKFWKFDITEPGEPVELFEFDLDLTPLWHVVYNSIAYFTSGEYPYVLTVLDGLEENEPNLVNEINDFPNSYLDMEEGNLVAFDTGVLARLYSLNDPLNPELSFVPNLGSKIFIRSNLIFVRYDHLIFVYENNSNCTEPIAIFNGLNHIYNVELMEYEGTNYLITIEMGNIGLFEYTYVPSSTEDELPEPDISLYNYPNPFNPETTISFNLPKTSEIQLEIYNIKGQKVKTLINDSLYPGNHSITWNGKDAAGKIVGSGLYLYKLKIGDKPELVKKCMLLK